MSPTPVSPRKVFIMYAHEDKDVRDKLLRHLRVQVVRGDIELWSDQEIKPGEVWDNAIRDRLGQSDIILLLLSDDFFNSDYIQNVELQEATRRHQAGECRLLPIIARACDWVEHPFLGRLQALPPDGKPVKSKGWDSEDEPYQAIVEGMKRAVRDLRGSEAPLSPAGPAERIAFPKLGALLLLALVAVGLGWWIWTLTRPSASGQAAQNVEQQNPASAQKPADSSAVAPLKNEPLTTPQTNPKPKTQSNSTTSGTQTPSVTSKKPGAFVFEREYEISEGMRLGKRGKLFGFLNLSTNKVIGWYEDAEKFSGGRAYVKQHGKYFYIDKTGKCVEDCPQ